MPTNLSEEEVEDVYAWVDLVPLSRPKRNISRDFSDGVLMAEAVSHFYPKLVEIHNYSAANAFSQKIYNWQTLNKKVMKRLGITLSAKEMEDACNCVPMVIEGMLFRLRNKVEEDKARLDSSGGRGAPVRSNNGGGAPFSAPARPLPHSSSPKAPSPQGAPRDHRQPHFTPPARGVRGQTELEREVDTEILIEKEQQIVELQETVAILETKVQKLEQLVKLKDAKIHALTARLNPR